MKGQNQITKYLELKSTTNGDVGLDLGLGMGPSSIVSQKNSTPDVVLHENLVQGKTTEAKIVTGTETTHQTSGIDIFVKFDIIGQNWLKPLNSTNFSQ